jgi:hypothetical protein
MYIGIPSLLVSQGTGVQPVETLNDSYSETNANSSVILMGQSGGLTAWYAGGQAFSSIGGKLSQVKFYLHKTGTPTGNLFAKLYAMSGTFGSTGIPTGPMLAKSNAINVATLTGSAQLIAFTFSGAQQYLMTNGTHYVIICDASDDASNTVTSSGNTSVIWRNGPSSTHPGDEAWTSNGWPSGSPTWNTDGVGWDVIFYVYSLI